MLMIRLRRKPWLNEPRLRGFWLRGLWFRGFRLGAQRRKWAFVTIGLARVANSPTVPNHLVAEFDPALLRHDLHQVALDSIGCGFGGHAKAIADSENVSIDHDTVGDAERSAENDIGGLARNAGESHKLVYRARNLAAKPLNDAARHSQEVFGLHAEETGGADEVLQLVGVGPCQTSDRRVARKQIGGYNVDAFVGALRAEDRRHEELIGVVMVKFAHCMPPL